MLKSLLQRAREARAAEFGDGEGLEEGFTLIELMVVLLIIAILLAIAIPTFLGVTGSANDRAAQSNLTNGLTELKAQYQNASSYGTAAALNTAMAASAPEFTWTEATAAATGSCSVNTATTKPCISFTPIDVASAADEQGVIIAELSKTGTCWYVLDMETNPAATASDPNPPGTFAFENGTFVPTAVTGTLTAGVYYAVRKNTTGTQCNAWYAGDGTSSASWGPSFSNPGTIA